MEKHEKQLTVAIIDDDESVLDAVKMVLEDQDWIANTYASGEAFLSDFKQLKPDCIILDSNLMGMSGAAVARSIRENLDTTPVVVLTAYPTTPQTIEIKKVGASMILVKPVSAMALIEQIQQVVTQNRIVHT